MERDIINAREAAAILSEKAGRTISPDYIRELRRQKRLTAINEPGANAEAYTRAYLFRRSDVEQVTIGAPHKRGVRTSRKKGKSHEFLRVSES